MIDRASPNRSAMNPARMLPSSGPVMYESCSIAARRPRRCDGIVAQQQPAPIYRVRQHTAPQCGDRERHELNRSEQTDDGRRFGEIVDLYRQRHVGEEATERTDELTGENKTEVPVFPQRR